VARALILTRRSQAVLCAMLVAFAAMAAVAFAQELPALTAPVNDVAHVIDGESARLLDQRIRALQSASGDVVVVATVPTFAPYGSIEEYAVKLFERAGIGQKNKDNGLLIVLALQERRVKIEVGYGLEDIVTDGYAGDVIRQSMLPGFRAGQYGAGLLAGTTRIVQHIAERRGVTLQNVPQANTGDERSGRGIPPFLIFVIILIVISVIRRAIGGPRNFRRGPPFMGPTWSGWSGGSGGFGGGFGGGGGGFGGFGGGRSGGGGASGGW